MISRSIFRNSNLNFGGCIFISTFKISPVTLIFSALTSNFTLIFGGSTTTLSLGFAAFAAPPIFTPFDGFYFFVSLGAPGADPVTLASICGGFACISTAGVANFTSGTVGRLNSTSTLEFISSSGHRRSVNVN